MNMLIIHLEQTCYVTFNPTHAKSQTIYGRIEVGREIGKMPALDQRKLRNYILASCLFTYPGMLASDWLNTPLNYSSNFYTNKPLWLLVVRGVSPGCRLFETASMVESFSVEYLYLKMNL